MKKPFEARERYEAAAAGKKQERSASASYSDSDTSDNRQSVKQAKGVQMEAASKPILNALQRGRQRNQENHQRPKNT